MDKYVKLHLKKDALKPGYILNEDIAAIPGLSTGHVLSEQDISKIIENASLSVIQVLSSRHEDTPFEYFKKVETKHKKPHIKADNFLSYMTDSAHNQELQAFNKGYIDEIRGQDYEAYVEEKFEFYHQKMDLKNNRDFNLSKQESEKALRTFIQSHRDISILHTLNPLKLDKMQKKVEMYEQVFDMFFHALAEDKVRYTHVLESVMLEIAMDFSQIPSRSLLALFTENYRKNHFFVHHSFQVTLLSIVLAIESTRLMHEKIEMLLENDIKAFIRISKKIYTLNDIIQLGIASMLHDIDYLLKIPEIHEHYHFDAKHYSIIDLHPSNGYNLAKSLNLDFEVQNAIYQHHERFDGSGYPHNLKAHRFSRYTPVLMFAEYYIEVTTTNPFNSLSLSPRKTVVQLLTQLRHQFDGDILMAFLRSASLFPVGTWVHLSDNSIGLVFDVNQDALESPVVRILYDQQLQAIIPYNIDLRKDGRKIKETVKSSIIHRLMTSAHPQIFRV